MVAIPNFVGVACLYGNCARLGGYRVLAWWVYLTLWASCASRVAVPELVSHEVNFDCCSEGRIDYTFNVFKVIKLNDKLEDCYRVDVCDRLMMETFESNCCTKSNHGSRLGVRRGNVKKKISSFILSFGDETFCNCGEL